MTETEPMSFADLTVREFVAELASSAPAPGGGAASAVIGATAASLVSMVAELSVGRPRLVRYAATINRSAKVGRRLGAELLRLADEDAQAFGAFMEVWKAAGAMAPDERQAAMSAAGRGSAEAPRSILGCCLVIADVAERLAGRNNPRLASDLLCASRAVEAASNCAAENVYVNLPNFADSAEADEWQLETKRMVADVERLARATRRVIARGAYRGTGRRPRGVTDPRRASGAP